MRRAVSTLWGALFLGACFQGTYLASHPCQKDTDCGPRLACNEGVCGGPAGVCERADGMVERLPSQVPVATDRIALVDAGLDGSCSEDEGLEAIYHWIAPEDGDYIAWIYDAPQPPVWVDYEVGWVAEDPRTEPHIHVHTGPCDGLELACGRRGPEGTARFSAAAGEPVTLVVDGVDDAWLDPAADYRLHLDRADFCLPDSDPLPPGVVAGDTYEREDRMQSPACGGFGAEATHLFRAPKEGRYSFDTLDSAFAFDSVVYVLDGHCGGPELGCNDDLMPGEPSSLAFADLAKDQEVVVVVDGYEYPGEYKLRIDDAFGCAPTELNAPEMGTLPGPHVSRIPGLEGEQILAFRKTLTEDQLVELEVTGPDGGPQPRLTVLEDGCVAVPLRSPRPSNRFRLRAGEYVVVLTTPSDDPHAFQLTEKVEQCPSESLMPLAPPEPGKPTIEAIQPGDDDFYCENATALGADGARTFVPAVPGTYEFSVDATPNGLGLFHPHCGKQIVCKEGPSGELSGESIVQYLEQGQEVIVAVQFPGAAGPAELTVTLLEE